MIAGSREAAVKAESVYQRAAAEWVARHNRTVEGGVSQIGHDGEPNALTLAEHITDVRLTHVGSYAYSEDTYDFGGAGLSYTVWDRTKARKSGKKKGQLYEDRTLDMEIRWYDGMDAGQFVQECVAILGEMDGKDG